MEKILIGLKNEMISNKKAPQPADGDMFWAARADWAQERIRIVETPAALCLPIYKKQARFLQNGKDRYESTRHPYPIFKSWD